MSVCSSVLDTSIFYAKRISTDVQNIPIKCTKTVHINIWASISPAAFPGFPMRVRFPIQTQPNEYGTQWEMYILALWFLLMIYLIYNWTFDPEACVWNIFSTGSPFSSSMKF